MVWMSWPKKTGSLSGETINSLLFLSNCFNSNLKRFVLAYQEKLIKFKDDSFCLALQILP